MRRAGFLAFLFCTCAFAQPVKPPPVESVTVTGERTRDEQIKSFVESRVAPTFRLGKVARWEAGLCPAGAGLKPDYLNFIIRRLKDTAAKVGVPVNKDPHCETNVEIVFSTKPQALLDNIRKSQSFLLGYYDNSRQADERARVTHAIQSWYVTATIDANGFPQVDRANKSMPFCMDHPECRIMTNAPNYTVTGSRLSNGLHSGYLNILIVADPTKLADYEMGAMADYISFLALTEPGSLDGCAPLPSILNLLGAHCANVTGEISNSDLGYLRALYRMTPDATLAGQKSEIAYQMKKAMDAQ
jgi:hypothetical protein